MLMAGCRRPFDFQGQASSEPGTFPISTATLFGATNVDVTGTQPIAVTGARVTTGWALYHNTTPIGVTAVTVLAGGSIRVSKSGLPTINRVTYDGSDATLADASGALLHAFDVVVPYPT